MMQTLPLFALLAPRQYSSGASVVAILVWLSEILRGPSVMMWHVAHDMFGSHLRTLALKTENFSKKNWSF